MKGIDVAWIITTLIALYGAGLATYNIYTASQKNKWKIKVRVANGFLTFGANLSDEKFILSASNVGYRAITLTSVGFLLPDKRTIVFPDGEGTRLPHHLNEGMGCQHFVSFKDIAEQLGQNGYRGTVNLVGFYRDATDGLHTSEPYSFDFAKWLG